MQIVNYVEREQPENLRLLTFASLARVTELSGPDSSLVQAVQFLCGPDSKVFDVGFTFIDENGEEHDVSKESVRDAETHGSFEHPETGVLYEDYENMIYPYFFVTSDG